MGCKESVTSDRLRAVQFKSKQLSLVDFGSVVDCCYRCTPHLECQLRVFLLFIVTEIWLCFTQTLTPRERRQSQPCPSSYFCINNATGAGTTLLRPLGEHSPSAQSTPPESTPSP